MHELCVAAPCLSRSCWCHMPGVPWLVVAAWLLHGRDLPHNRNVFAGCCWQCLGCLLLMVSGQIAAPAAVWACCSACRTNVVLQQPRPGCCCVPEACAHEIFCCMLFAVPFLLTSNGQRLKMMPRLLCVPARLLPASQACRLFPPGLDQGL